MKRSERNGPVTPSFILLTGMELGYTRLFPMFVKPNAVSQFMPWYNNANRAQSEREANLKARGVDPRISSHVHEI